MTSLFTDTSKKLTVFSYDRWLPQLPQLKKRYTMADPFPSIVLENFLEEPIANQAVREFPAVDSESWIFYIHLNEKKFGKNDLSTFGSRLKSIVEELNSDRFILFLSELTGIEGLFADPDLEGGGLHQSEPGGFLNIHADFTVHPHHRNWKRTLNLLLYLNKDWKDSYGGHIELWDTKMSRCVQKIAPIFNRCVIFATNQDSYHGHPEPLKCPNGMTRKSLALYYYTAPKAAPLIRSSEYKARPDDGFKRVWIYLDKMAVRIYDAMKRKLGIKDTFASNILKFIYRLKKNRNGKETAKNQVNNSYTE